MGLRDEGRATRRAVLGDAHVDRSEGNRTDFDGPFVDLITDAAWGHVWSRDTISKRERSMLTLAILAGVGNFEEFKLHLNATRNTGASREDILDVLLHVAIYAGVPRANHAIALAKTIFAEWDAEEGA